MRVRTVALLAALAAVGVRSWRRHAAQRPEPVLLPPGPPVEPVVEPPAVTAPDAAPPGASAAEAPEEPASELPAEPDGSAEPVEQEDTPEPLSTADDTPETDVEAGAEPDGPAPRPLAAAAAAPLVAAPLPDLPAPEPGLDDVPEPLPSGWEVVEVAAPAPPPRAAAPLRGISEIRRFFRTNDVPIWFVSATAFNLLGIDRWVRRFTYVNYYDSFDGTHPNVFVPTHHAPPTFDSIEEINAYLLSHKEVIDRIGTAGGGGKAALPHVRRRDRAARTRGGARGRLPVGRAAAPARLEDRDDPTRRTRPACRACRTCSAGRARTRACSRSRAAPVSATTSSCRRPTATRDRRRSSSPRRTTGTSIDDQLVDEHLKVMKRIDCREAAIEGVITRHGTLVGPLMTELTGYPGADAVRRRLVRQRRLRERSHASGTGSSRGSTRSGWATGSRRRATAATSSSTSSPTCDSGELYLGELNPRVTGASSMTNVTAVAYGDMPLFLFHLLEFMDVDYEIDVDELNEQWARPSAIDEWSQFILKDTADKVELITEAPASGIWRLDPEAHGGIRFVRRETDWHTVANEDEAFYLRIAQAGGYRYPGADIGILVTRGRLQTDDHELTERARTWITGIKRQFWTVPIPAGEPEPVRDAGPFSFKML